MRLDIIFNDTKSRGHPLFPAHLRDYLVPPHGEPFGRRVRKTAQVSGSQERTGHPRRGEPPCDRPCGGTLRVDHAGGAVAPPQGVVLHVRSGAYGCEYRYRVRGGVCESNGVVQFGYSEDKRPDTRQVNFGAAELRNPINILIDLSVDRGNTSDSVRFVKIVDEIRRPSRRFSVRVRRVRRCEIGARPHNRTEHEVYHQHLNNSDDLWISKFDKKDAICRNPRN